MTFDLDVCIVGGCGHVGLPLALVFADRGMKVGIHDIDEATVARVRKGEMPFLERGAECLIEQALKQGLEVANDPDMISRASYVVVVIGTPVDEHLNPRFDAMRRFFRDTIIPRLVEGQCVILRSTVYPGTTDKMNQLVRASEKQVSIAFCPERVAEGHALREMVEQPQIVAGCDQTAQAKAELLFGRVTQEIVRLSPLEAELTKIFTNTWRDIQFATANQFYMIAADHGLDFYKIHQAMTHHYPRMAGVPCPGFAAGPCLFKDTMQLSAAANHQFALGHAAMLINEGLPDFVVRQLKSKYPLDTMRVGILGMAFKAESDDPRESLSYKLKKLLAYETAEVLCTDEYVRDTSFLPLAEVIKRSDLLIIGAPHQAYRKLDVPPGKPVLDVWNILGKGGILP